MIRFFFKSYETALRTEQYSILKGERNQMIIWGFTEFRTNKNMKI